MQKNHSNGQVGTGSRASTGSAGQAAGQRRVRRCMAKAGFRQRAGDGVFSVKSMSKT